MVLRDMGSSGLTGHLDVVIILCDFDDTARLDLLNCSGHFGGEITGADHVVTEQDCIDMWRLSRKGTRISRVQ